MTNYRLKNQRCYLAGAIDRVPDRGTQWREFITPFLESLGVEVFNPLKKPTNLGAEDESVAKYKKTLKENKQFDTLSELMRNIRSVDLRMVDVSDFLIVNLDIDTHPCGTLEEIFWANRQKKPILVHMVQGKTSAPDWLFGTIPHQLIFNDWSEIMSYLTDINCNHNKPNTYNRWVFFNHRN
jgi:nucleoside 2-deoxyribosyltransferase